MESPIVLTVCFPAQPKSILLLQKFAFLLATMFSLIRGFSLQAPLRYPNKQGILARSSAFRHILSASPSDPSPKADDQSYSLCLSIPTLEEMEEVGALMSVMSNTPDVLFLDGGQ
jgi:hypothetical protein